MRPKKEFVYVTRRLDGVRFCVDKEYYKKYRDTFSLEESNKVEEEPIIDHIDLSIDSEVDKPTRSYKNKKKV